MHYSWILPEQAQSSWESHLKSTWFWGEEKLEGKLILSTYYPTYLYYKVGT